MAEGREANPISVTLAVGSDAYQQQLPAALLREGMLLRLLSFRPGPEVADPKPDGSLVVVKRFPAFDLVNRILWAVWRRLPGSGQSHFPKAATTWLADRLASPYVAPARIFHGLSGTCLTCMQTAKAGGATTLLESSTLHLQHWQEEVIADCARFGIDPRECSSLLPGALIRRARREYDLCDRIVVLSSAARQSFERFGHGHKLMTTLPGVDHNFFAPSKRDAEPTGLFRACYVGRVEVAKGVGDLLRAWKLLGLKGAELLLIGEVRAEMEGLLKRYAAPSITLLGALPASEVARRYQQSNVLVLPSANEALGMVLLEAMSSGVAVIATDRTGAPDLVTDGREGFIVPARNVDALAERILACYRHRDETRSMGRAARTRVEQNFTVAHYLERQIGLYRQIGEESRQTARSDAGIEAQLAG